MLSHRNRLGMAVAALAAAAALALPGPGRAQPAQAGEAQRFTAVAAGGVSAAVDLAWEPVAGAAHYRVIVERGARAVGRLETAEPRVRAERLNVGFLHGFRLQAVMRDGAVRDIARAEAFPLYAPKFAYRCARELWVGPQGDDRADGRTRQTAFATIQRAADDRALGAGTCITLLPGEYHEKVTLDRGGRHAGPDGLVVLRALTPLTARVIGPHWSYSTIDINANYVAIDGLDVDSAAGHCIDSSPQHGAHHIAVLRSRLHDCGGSGVSFAWGSHYTVEGNIATGNARSNPYHTSGISIYQARPVVARGEERWPGFANVIRNNVAHDNGETFDCNRCHTDGNGVIIDDFRNTQKVGERPPTNETYPYATLVENNLAFNNGGRGIVVFLSDHVTVRANTAFGNERDDEQDGHWRAEFGNSQSSDILWEDNLAISDRPHVAAFQLVGFGDGGVGNVRFRGNVASHPLGASVGVRVEGVGALTTAGGVTFADPGVRDAAAAADRADFRPIDARRPSRRAAEGPADNLNGEPRRTGAPGAY